MTIGAARKWLAIYFLLTAVAVGLYLLLFPATWILPLGRDDANACFEILLPVLIGQVTVIFQWFALASAGDAENIEPSPIPDWAIKLPPILVLLIIIASAVALSIANMPPSHLQLGPEGFKAALTFAVSIMNASTVLLVSRLFPSLAKK